MRFNQLKQVNRRVRHSGGVKRSAHAQSVGEPGESWVQWVKLQSDIGHFPSIFGTCPTKNQYVLPNCPNAQRAMNAHAQAQRAPER